MANYIDFRNRGVEQSWRLYGIGFVQTSLLIERHKGMVVRMTETSLLEGTRADKDTEIHLTLINCLLLGQKQTYPIHKSFLGQIRGIYILIPCYLYNNTASMHRRYSRCEMWLFPWFNCFRAGSGVRSPADCDLSVSRSIPLGAHLVLVQILEYRRAHAAPACGRWNRVLTHLQAQPKQIHNIRRKSKGNLIFIL